MRRWTFGAITTTELAFATESAFLAVVFSFNLLSEFQRAIDPALKSYKRPATLRFEVFTRGAILGRSGHHLVLHMSKTGVAIRNESRSLPASYIGLRQLLRNLTRQQKMPHDFQFNFGNLGLNQNLPKFVIDAG
jgi:hypothetical protein